MSDGAARENALRGNGRMAAGVAGKDPGSRESDDFPVEPSPPKHTVPKPKFIPAKAIAGMMFGC